MTTIMIMGDSYACGEWNGNRGGDRPSEYRVQHPGTQKYLADAGHRVITVADGGSSNWSQLDRISPHHPYQKDRNSGHNLAEADVVLWFMTDPLRDLTNQPTTMADFQTRPDSLLRDSTEHLRGLVGDRPVWIVGGVGRVPHWVQTEYPTWRVIVPDLMGWLCPEVQVSTVHLCRGWLYGHCEPELMAHHEAEEQRVSNFIWRAEHRTDCDGHRWFWPDGAHPNREAHRRLTQELILPLL
jgi:hypothetical protein